MRERIVAFDYLRALAWNNNSRMEYDMSFLKQRFF